MFCRLARNAALFSALTVLFAVVGACQSSGSNSATSDASSRLSSADAQQEISALLDQYSQALMNKDAAMLDRIWSDDLTFINLRGELLNKRNRMDNIKTGATAFKSIHGSDKRIRSYGEAAVAVCSVALEAQYSGQEGSGNYRVTTVWARPKGMWQMVAVQMTRVAL